MANFVYTFQLQQVAVAYGEGNYNTETYSANNTTNTAPDTTPGVVAPGAPNTGLLGGAFSGVSEASLIPLLLIVAVVIGVATVAVRKVIKKRRA